jgi:hypothetical protein
MLDPSIISCCSVESLWKLRSLILIQQLGLDHRHDVNFSVPLTRYISGSYMALPVRTIVLVERPYRTDIHPYAASAMSYDPAKDPRITPSTAVLATDLKNRLDVDWNETEAWFRDSWMYIKAGVFLINICCFEEFMGNSLNERVSVESFVRDMVVASYNMSGHVVELVALGNPAISSANRIRANVADRKHKLKVHRGQNPAGLRHRFGDLTSPDITVGSKELSRALYRAIVRSSTSPKCTESDFDNMTTIKQANLKSKLVSAHRDLDEDLEQVALFFKNGGKYEGPVSDEQVFTSLRKSASKFMETLIDERVIIKLADLRENDSSAKGAYHSGNRGYEPKSFKQGSSSEVSGMSKNKPTPTPQKTKWLDEEDEAAPTPSKPQPIKSESTTTVMTPASSAPQTPQKQTPLRPPMNSGRSVSGQSAMGSAMSSKLKFIDEDSDEDRPVLNLNDEKPDLELNAELDALKSPSVESYRPLSPTMMNSDEAGDMALVGEFLHTNSTNYGVAMSIMQEINEAATTSRASSDVSKEVLEVVRQMRKSGTSTLEDDLGFTDGQAAANSSIIRLILKWAD